MQATMRLPFEVRECERARGPRIRQRCAKCRATWASAANLASDLCPVCETRREVRR